MLRIAAILALMVLGVGSAHAYPTKPVKLIVPFGAGGPIDVMGRLVAQWLTSALGQQVVVDNRPGASGAIGTRAAAAAEPDGHTLLIGSVTTMVTGPLLARNLGYEPLKDFVPVAMLASTPFALVVAPKLPIRTLEDLIAFARADPGRLNFGTPIGTLAHLTGELFKTRTGVDFVVIPYKGASTAVTDILAGQVDMAFEPTSVLVTHIHEGKVRALAVTAAQRSRQLPEVPTLIERGMEGFTSLSWAGVLAPAGTPPEIVTTLNAAINRGLNPSAIAPSLEQSLQQSLRRLGAEASGGSPRDFAELIAEETLKWGSVISSAGVKLD